MYCNILVTKPLNTTFTYKVKSNQSIKIGHIVKVPFGNKKFQLGIVREIFEEKINRNTSFKIKEIDHVYDNLFLNKDIIKFIDWIADYTLAPKGLVLKLFIINQNIINHQNKEEIDLSFKPKLLILNADQKKAYKIIKKSLNKNLAPIVLEGVTGSGKTEVYLEIIKKIIIEKKQVLIMLPEISLTSQLEKRIKKILGFAPDIWHSKVSQKNKKNTWHKCYQGNVSVVIGARSSLFLPFKNLGIIIVDEEHDLSYKQEENIRYQARDLAIVRGKIERIPVVLSSATPSLETQNNIFNKKFNHTFLPKQYSGIDLPEIELVDLQKEKKEKNKWISSKIISHINSCLEKDEQILLFLNRRGYSPLSICSKCGHRYKCDHCSSWLVMHRNKNRLLCHQCGAIYDIKINCPKCNFQNSLNFIGPGVERLEEEIKEFFPQISVKVMSSDNANTPLKIQKILSDFERNKINILVATQIMAKGYHFPNLSLVGVIDADAGLMGGDIKAIERTYNLLQQVGGRAGRSKKKGKVLIQTFFPFQPIIQSIKNRDRKNFILHSLAERKQFNLPPYSFLTALIVLGHSKANAQRFSINLTRAIDSNNQIDVLGPVEAPLFMLRGKYRYRILLKSKSRRLLNSFTKKILEKCPTPSNLRLIIDVDPYTFI